MISSVELFWQATLIKQCADALEPHPQAESCFVNLTADPQVLCLAQSMLSPKSSEDYGLVDL